nr:TrkA family potassium uptake protein [Clostridium swellfunianum]
MKQFAVIGLGRFGSSIAKVLSSSGYEVLAVDKDMERIQGISDEVTHAIQADVTSESSIRSLGISNFDVVVVSIASDLEASILVTLMAKELGAKYVVAKARSESHAKVLSKIGADKIVFPERDMAERIAHNIISSNILDYIELSPEYSIMELAALEEWQNKSLGQLTMRRRYGINVLAIKHNDKINAFPNADDIIREKDVIIAVGHNDDLDKIRDRRK